MFGDEGASEGDEEAATTDAGAESEASAAEFADVDKEDVAGKADEVTGSDLRWIHEYDRGEDGTLGVGAEEVLDRRRAFIAPPRIASTHLPLLN